MSRRAALGALSCALLLNIVTRASAASASINPYHEVVVRLLDDVPDMDAGAHLDAPLGRNAGVALGEPLRYVDRAADRLDHAAGLGVRTSRRSKLYAPQSPEAGSLSRQSAAVS